MTNSNIHKIRTMTRDILFKKDTKERKKSRKGRLNNDVYSFKENIEINPFSKKTFNKLARMIFNECFSGMSKGIRKENYRMALKILLANLLSAHEEYNRLAISLDSNNYSRAKIGYTIFKNTITALTTHHFIDIEKGFHNPITLKGRSARIWFTQKSQDLIKNISISKGSVYLPVKPVVLKDEGKNPIKYKLDNDFIRQWEGNIKKINKVNSNSKFEYIDCYHESKLLNPFLHSVFSNRSWKQGGRFYSTKGGHLLIKREQRKTITIDGQDSCELDYSAMHIRLLYAEQGIAPKRKDLYDIYPDKTLRNIVKPLFLTFINCRDPTQAIRAGNQYLYENRMHAVIKKHGLKVNNILQRLASTHYRIADSICSGRGLFLQAKDANIAMDVLLHFINQDIPILPVHDSFIVKKENKAELEKTMRDVFKTHTNVECGKIGDK